MAADRTTAICLLSILREYSDSEHILQMGELIRKFEALYGTTVDRRTIYGMVELLQNLGYDISSYSENKKGYYLRERDFELSEIRLLMDAVCSFPFISAEQTKALMGKLQKCLSIHERKKYRHLSVVRQERKTQNKQVFLNVELLDEAIENKKKVSFSYLSYNAASTLVPRMAKPYVVSPYNMVYTNEHYYLICIRSHFKNISLYRIDRMADLKTLDEPSGDIPGSLNIEQAVNDAIYAFTGVPEEVALYCDKSILNDVIDRFGAGIKLTDAGERYLVRFTAPPAGVKYWVLQYLEHVELTEPQWLRDEIINRLKNNYYIKGEQK